MLPQLSSVNTTITSSGGRRPSSQYRWTSLYIVHTCGYVDGSLPVTLARMSRSAAKNIGPVAAAAGPESGRTACACVALAATRVTPAVTASAAITSLDLAMCCSFLEEGVPLKGAVSTPI